MSKVNLSNLTNLQSEVAAVTTINNNNTLITQAIENTISRDGTLPNMMNSRLDMNSNQIINLPDATTDQEPVTYGQYVSGITSVNNGVVVDGAFILAEHDDTTINDRVLVAGTNLQVTDGGPKGNFTVSVSDDELNAIADVVSAEDKVPYFTGSGTADVADFTPYARTLVDDVDAETARATLGLVIDTDVQPHDPTLNSLVSAGNGIMTKTAANTITPRTITAPANGISITDGDGVAGNPTLALTNDLAAIEGLATTGIIARTATDTAATRTVTGTANEITVTDGDGVAGNPTVSIPNSVTFTGKTVTGGTFSSPTINTPSGITKSDVGLSNVDNTSDATKNAAVATLTNKTLTSPVINSPTGIVKGDVGLGNVDNTSDATKNAASATLTNKIISGSSNTLSDIANASLSSAADSTIKSNISGSAASPSDNTITAVLDKQLGTTQGTIAYRGASSWDALTPGTSGYFLQTQGASADPTWTAVPGGGDLLSTNNLSDVADATTALLNLGAREVLTADRTYYVLTTGSDTNTGLTNTAGGAFLTIQKAIDTVCSLDCSIYNVTIQVGAGTYTQPLTLKYVLGSGTYTIQGDTTTPSNVTISTTSASCFSISGHPTPWSIKGFKMQTTTSGQCLYATNNATLLVTGNVEFGACAGYHIFCSTAVVNITSNYRITGGANCHINCVNSGVITFGGGTTTTGVGTLAFGQFCFVNRGAGVIHYGGTFSGGTYTGTRYLGASVAYIDTNGGGANYFPGNAAGSVSSGAQYV
jgi:hypothetical protein